MDRQTESSQAAGRMDVPVHSTEPQVVVVVDKRSKRQKVANPTRVSPFAAPLAFEVAKSQALAWGCNLAGARCGVPAPLQQKVLPPGDLVRTTRMHRP